MAKGTHYKYPESDERDVSLMVDWMKQKMNHNIQVVKHKDQLQDILETEELLVLYYGDRHNARYQMFKTADFELQYIAFVYTENGNIQWKYGLKKNHIYVITK